jgi:hypothetical protein
VQSLRIPHPHAFAMYVLQINGHTEMVYGHVCIGIIWRGLRGRRRRPAPKHDQRRLQAPVRNESARAWHERQEVVQYGVQSTVGSRFSTV